MADNQSGTLKTGTVLNGKWVILELIGKGGMGEVYRAYQLNLKRDVAVKIVSGSWLKTFDCDTEQIHASMDRFRREVEIMAQVQHPNVLQIYDHGTLPVDSVAGDENAELEYIVMEFVPGSTLRTTMSEEGFYPEEDLIREWIRIYFLPLLDGIRALHEAGIVHRDMKPENVLLERNAPKIADFGLARSGLAKPLTLSFDALGTPPYMPPEQFMDLRRTDQRTDIYALGKILYEAIAGKMGPDTQPFKQAHLEQPKTPFFLALDQVIRDATAEDRNQRTESAEQLQQALVACLEGRAGGIARNQPQPFVAAIKPKLPRGIRWWLPFLVMVMMAVAGVIYLRQPEPPPSHHAMMESSSHMEMSQQQPAQEAPRAVPDTRTEVAEPAVSTPDRSIVGKDRAVLHLVPSGQIPKEIGDQLGLTESGPVASFYMDETWVTNHQYVNFLNQVADRIEVAQGAVRSDQQIWLLLGPVSVGYEPIIYRDGRFRVATAHHAACPVLRVSADGAAAYAAYYGRRLPTLMEWLHATLNFQQPNTPSAPYPPIPSPVMAYPKNRLGLRGLHSNIREWTSRPEPAESNTAKPSLSYLVMGTVSSTDLPSQVRRQNWEAFGDVSFRCVQSMVPKATGVNPAPSPPGVKRNNGQ